MKRMLIAGLLTEEEAEPAVQRRKPALGLSSLLRPG
jgi:hypothetical protein